MSNFLYKLILIIIFPLYAGAALRSSDAEPPSLFLARLSTNCAAAASNSCRFVNLIYATEVYLGKDGTTSGTAVLPADELNYLRYLSTAYNIEKIYDPKSYLGLVNNEIDAVSRRAKNVDEALRKIRDLELPKGVMPDFAIGFFLKKSLGLAVPAEASAHGEFDVGSTLKGIKALILPALKKISPSISEEETYLWIAVWLDNTLKKQPLLMGRRGFTFLIKELIDSEKRERDEGVSVGAGAGASAEVARTVRESDTSSMLSKNKLWAVKEFAKIKEPLYKCEIIRAARGSASTLSARGTVTAAVAMISMPSSESASTTGPVESTSISRRFADPILGEILAALIGVPTPAMGLGTISAPSTTASSSEFLTSAAPTALPGAADRKILLEERTDPPSGSCKPCIFL